jgi:outer membrane protein OmpA-like peptidoglycan-associated protein
MARSYEAALTNAGFKILYRCSGIGCADPLPKSKYVRSEGVQASALSNLIMSRAGYHVAGVYEDQRYVAAHLARPEGDVYVSMLALRSPMVQLDVIEVKAMHADLVTVNAATMAAEIAARGSVALYGIYFDTDKSDVKPESRPTLNEIATLLKQNAALELIVVGHTDNKGTIEYNLDLSQRRARAVVSALVTNFGIEGKRLDPRGVGFLAPVAPNTSEDGRAKNRRVQLIAR